MPTALERVFEAAGCRTQSQLADLLGIRQSSISDAKKRGAVPAEWLVKLLRLKKVNPEWILTGQGARFLHPADAAGVAAAPLECVTEIRPPEDCSLEALIMEIARRALQKMG